MANNLDSFSYSKPRFLLMYSALQFGPEEMAKPDGSLSLPYLAGALREFGYDVNILDVSVGAEDDSLQDSFFNTQHLASGLIRCGMPTDRVRAQIEDFDVIGVSSIFTTQTTMVLDLIRLAKQTHPDKLVIAGGVNARNLRKRFFDAGADLIVLSEAERTIVQIRYNSGHLPWVSNPQGNTWAKPARQIIYPSPPPSPARGEGTKGKASLRAALLFLLPHGVQQNSLHPFGGVNTR